MRRGPLTVAEALARLDVAAPDLPPHALPPEDPVPWHVLALATLGAVLAGAALIAAIASAFAMLDLEPLPGTLLGGIAALAAGIALGPGEVSVFRRQFAVTAGVAGHALLSAAGFVWGESVGAAAVASVLAAALSLPLLRDPAYRFMATAVAVALTDWALHEATHGGPLAVAVVTVPAVLWLLLHPPRGADLRPVAYALLLVPMPFLDLMAGHGWRALGAAPYALGTVWLLRPLLAGASGKALAAGALALAALLPGAAAAVMVLTLAWRLGGRVLAGLGVAALLGFVARFYYDLEVTLLAKSALLMAGGLLTLALWAVARRGRA